MDLAFGVEKHANGMNGEAVHLKVKLLQLGSVQVYKSVTIGKCTDRRIHYNWEVYRCTKALQLGSVQVYKSITIGKCTGVQKHYNWEVYK